MRVMRADLQHSDINSAVVYTYFESMLSISGPEVHVRCTDEKGV